MITDSLDLPEYEMTITPTEGVSIGAVQSLLEVHMMPLFNFQSRDNRNIYIPEDSYFSPNGGNSYKLILYGIPRFPSQLFEAAGYFIIFLLLLVLGEKKQLDHRGRIFGIFLILVFGFRIAVEFLKANQKQFEATMDFNMGQILSLPLVIIGFYLVIKSLRFRLKS